MDGWKRICSWCGRKLDGLSNAGNVSHGICLTCCIKVRQELEDLEEACEDHDHLWQDIGGEG
jgi:hypothetical protein